MRPMRRHPLLAALMISSAVALACSDSLEPMPGDELAAEELFILSLAAGTPSLEGAEVSFYAKKGQERRGQLYFQDASGGRGDELLRFEVGEKTLLAQPDGTQFQSGDSVLITIRLVDPARLLFDFAPSGLRFDPDDPAKLRINYAYADTTARSDRDDDEGDDDGDDDEGDDGDDDEDDDEGGWRDDVEPRLGIWRQNDAGTPFVRLGSAVLKNEDRVEADLDGFSRYAVGY